MSSLLSNHSKFEWENYGVEWEIDHVIPFEVMVRHSVSDRYKHNNWSNLAPKTSEQNKKERNMKLDAARSAKTQASRPAETEASRLAETEAARTAETQAPTEPESQCY
jgi:5-methylcytosine-specific restriction endonuclease McrA